MTKVQVEIIKRILRNDDEIFIVEALDDESGKILYTEQNSISNALHEVTERFEGCKLIHKKAGEYQRYTFVFKVKPETNWWTFQK